MRTDERDLGRERNPGRRGAGVAPSACARNAGRRHETKPPHDDPHGISAARRGPAANGGRAGRARRYSGRARREGGVEARPGGAVPERVLPGQHVDGFRQVARGYGTRRDAAHGAQDFLHRVGRRRGHEVAPRSVPLQRHPGGGTHRGFPKGGQQCPVGDAVRAPLHRGPGRRGRQPQNRRSAGRPSSLDDNERRPRLAGA